MKHRTKIIILIAIVLLIACLHFMGIGKYINFQTFKENREYLKLYVNEHYLVSVILYILIYILIVISTLPLAGFSTVISGFLFGVIFGTIYSVIAGTIGATISFLIMRYLIGNYIQKKYEKRLHNFNENINNYGAIYLLILHVVAVVPFFVINTLSSLTNVSLFTFIWTTAIGIIPGSIVYAYAGKELGAINKISDIFTGEILIAFGLLGLLGFISLIVKRYQSAKTK